MANITTGPRRDRDIPFVLPHPDQSDVDQPGMNGLVPSFSGFITTVDSYSEFPQGSSLSCEGSWPFPWAHGFLSKFAWSGSSHLGSLGIHAFDTGRGRIDLDVPVLLLLVYLLVLLGPVPRVVALVLSEGVCSVNIIERFNLDIISQESLLGVGDIKFSIHSSF